MIKRRDLIQTVAMGAVVGTLIPVADARSVSLQNGDLCRAEIGREGPLLATPPGSLMRWMGARYGAFLHWGPVTVSGKEISWSREVDTPYEIYDNLYKKFDPVEFDADAWIRMIKDSGFRYVVFVTKHHDGFAMWNTKTTTHSIMHTPFHRDVLGEIAAACKQQNFPLCLYYSIADLYQPDCIGSRHANGMYLGPPGFKLPPGEKPNFDRYVRYMKAQLKELSENYGQILAWWFDGGWMSDWTYERGVDLLKYMRSMQPETLTDQRVGCAYNGSVYMPTWFPTDVNYVGDFAVLEVDLPRFNRRIPWEYTTPANGRSYAWTPGTYGDPTDWLANLVKSACGDGNYLLGLEPPKSGRFDPALVDKLRETKPWIERYGESVFETRGGPYMRTNVYGTTCKGNRIYLHIYDRTLTHLSLAGLPLTITRSYMLNGGDVRVTQEHDRVDVRISSNSMELPSTIVVMEIDGSAEEIGLIEEAPVNRRTRVLSSNKRSDLNANLCDGDRCTFWKADSNSGPIWFEFDLGSVRTISRAVLIEGWYQGEYANIHDLELLVNTDGQWKSVADIQTWGAGTPQESAFNNWPMSVFHQEIRFSPVNTRYVWVKIKRVTAAPVIHEFDIYER